MSKPRHRARDERGASLSALVAPVMMAVFLSAGLVVDGTAQMQAQRRAEVSAARAVRAGCDASAAQRLIGQDGSAAGLEAARSVLAQNAVEGEVSVQDGQLVAQTRASERATFLALLGVDELEGLGTATGELRRR